MVISHSPLSHATWLSLIASINEHNIKIKLSKDERQQDLGPRLFHYTSLITFTISYRCHNAYNFFQNSSVEEMYHHQLSPILEFKIIQLPPVVILFPANKKPSAMVIIGPRCLKQVFSRDFTITICIVNAVV